MLALSLIQAKGNLKAKEEALKQLISMISASSESTGDESYFTDLTLQVVVWLATVGELQINLSTDSSEIDSALMAKFLGYAKQLAYAQVFKDR